jgi:hypothetical protein
VSRSRPRQALAPLRPGAVIQELFSHGLLLALVLSADLGYFGLMLLLALEVPLITVFSMTLYPERGFGRHLGDLIKGCAMMAFLLVFIVVSLSLALGREPPELSDPQVFDEVLRWKPAVLAWSLGFAALHLLALRWQAARGPNPRLVWASLVLTQGGVSAVTLLIMVFAGFAVGAGLVPLLRMLWPPLDPHLPLVLATVMLRLFFALLISRMPASEMAEMSRNPYVD